jgi:hypothetical protein
MKKDNDGNFNHEEDFGKNMSKLLNLLRKIMKHQKFDNDELKTMFQDISKDKNSINFNVFFALMPMSPEELEDLNGEFEELFEDEGYRDQIDADLKFELSTRDEDFLKKHGIKF